MAASLYVHWPFCLSKCPYCDFNSHVRRAVDTTEWCDAILQDLRYEASQTSDSLTSLFFGGGTPSLMEPALVADIIEEAHRSFGFDADVEITLEANPTSVETERFAALAAAGVNRVSLGVQSFRDDALRFLGRGHGSVDAHHALDVAQAVFGRVSFDLIYARPGQDEAAWRAELAEGLARETEHLSLYQLTIEPGTRFATEVRRGTFAPLDDDAAAALYDVTGATMARAGLPAYEISNYARPGAESRHNLTYWRYRDYIGIGPGAHGRRGGIATQRHRKPENYLAAVARTGHGIAQQSLLSRADGLTEAILMGLRLREGISPDLLGERFGTGAIFDERKVRLHVAGGLLERTGDRMRATHEGMRVLDALLADIVAGDLMAA